MSGYNPHHTVELDLNSKLLRYYVKTWDARVEENADVNLCKMFWGVLFSPLVWFLRIISWPIRKFVGEPKPPHYKTLAELDAEREERERKKQKRAESKWMKALGKITYFISKHAPKLKYVAYGFFGAYLIWVVVLVVIAFIKYPITMLLALGVGILAIAVIFTIIKLSEAKKLGWVGRSVNKIKKAVVGFFKFMWSGAMAVKSATCPRIVVKSDG